MIDVVITDNGADKRLSPSKVARALGDAGYHVRTVVVLSSDTGSVGTYYADQGAWPTSKGER